MITGKVTINIDPKVIEQRLEGLLDTETKIEIGQILADVIDPWTPFLTGQLSQNVFVSEDTITYMVPYAADKYYGNVYCKEYHPLATSHWDKVALETQMPVLVARVQELLIARAKELYG